MPVQRENGWLEITVQDDGPGFSRDDVREGHGLDTLEKRVALLYGESGVLSIEGNRVRPRLPVGVPAVSLRVYLVDDEELAVRRLDRMLRETGRVEIVGSSTDSVRAQQEIELLAPDALFLDIQMPGMTGFDLLASLSFQPLVVFATAYDQYALRAFEVQFARLPVETSGGGELDRALGKLERLAGGEMPRPALKSLIEQVQAALQGQAKQEGLQLIPSRIGGTRPFH
ncbi:MAG: response regulator [Paludibaculum sp.]